MFTQMQTYDPLREHALVDALEEVLAVVVRVQSSSHLGLLPQKGGLALRGPESELDKLGLALVRNEAEGVHTPSIHMPVRANSAMTAHRPEQSMERRRLLAEEVPGAIMSSSSLRNLAVWPGLDSMNQVRELDSILNKEDGDVVTNNI
jgi:hypothetical protein